MESFETVTLPHERLSEVYSRAMKLLDENTNALNAYAERSHEEEKREFEKAKEDDVKRAKEWAYQGLFGAPSFAIGMIPRGYVRMELDDLRIEIETMLRACAEVGHNTLAPKGVITLSYQQFQRMQRFSRGEVIESLLERARK